MENLFFLICLWLLIVFFTGFIIRRGYSYWVKKYKKKKAITAPVYASLIPFLKHNNFAYENVCEHGMIRHKFYAVIFDVTDFTVGYKHKNGGWLWLANDSIEKVKESIKASITYCEIHYNKTNAAV